MSECEDNKYRPNEGQAIVLSTLDIANGTARACPFLFCTHAMEGSGGFFDGSYLVEFDKERQFANRKKMAHYKNMVRGVIDSLVVPVFSEEPVRSYTGNSNMFEAFVDDCNRAGDPLEVVNKQVQRYSALHGVSFAVVDNVGESELSAYREENIKRRLFPYIYHKRVDEVNRKYLVSDRWGNLEQIAFVAEDGKNEDGTRRPQFRLWNKQESYLFFEKDGKAVRVPSSENAHGLGVVPVVVQYENGVVDGVIPDVPNAYELCRLNLTIYNQDSEQRNIERMAAFPMLTMQDEDTDESKEVGSDQILVYSAGIDGASVNPPEWLSPSSDILKVLSELSNDNRSALIEEANLLGATAVTKGEAKSGVAMSYEFLGQNFALKSRGNKAEEFEYKVAKIFSLYSGDTFEYTVAYQDNYRPSTQDFTARVDLVSALIDAGVFGESGTKALKIGLAKEVAAYTKYDIDTEKMAQELSANLL